MKHRILAYLTEAWNFHLKSFFDVIPCKGITRLTLIYSKKQVPIAGSSNTVMTGKFPFCSILDKEMHRSFSAQFP
jgi:hypothetical protein